MFEFLLHLLLRRLLRRLLRVFNRVWIYCAVCFYSRRFQIFRGIRRPPCLHDVCDVCCIAYVIQYTIFNATATRSSSSYCMEHLPMPMPNPYRGRVSIAAQHSSHANPWCCWFATFFNTSLDLRQFAHWNFRNSLSLSFGIGIGLDWMDNMDILFGVFIFIFYEH